MAVPFLSTAFVSGEITPAAYGRVDIDRERVGATTMRNCFVDYRGGARSRAGTRFVGFSKQTGRDFPPRLIPFQFSINQGLVLEFGHQYMRVIINGAYVTESPVSIGGATRADPCVLTFGAEGASATTPNNAAVTFSYAPGDFVTLSGGTTLAPAVLEVTTSELLSIVPDNPGSGYGIGDTITLAGGASTATAIATVTSITAVAASGFYTFTDNPADGDTLVVNGVTWTFKTAPTGTAETKIQPTLAGTMSQLAADLTASSDASLTVANYSAQPAELQIVYGSTGTAGNSYTIVVGAGTPASASGATLTGGTTTGVGSITIGTAGVYTALPSGAQMTQSSTSGGGTGATFQTAVFGPHAVSISNPGAYLSVPANPVSQASTTGIGQGATFNVTWAPVSPFSNDDWLYVTGVEGMIELNGNTYRGAGVTATSVELLDIYGVQVDSTGYSAYTGGGTVAKIYTLATPYNEADLRYLKFTQSADVMTICCVNQETGTEYAPQNLSRNADDDWSLSAVVETPSVSPPASTSATISGSGTTNYEYAVTAISPEDGSESVSSPTVAVEGVSISTQAGQVSVSWTPVAGVDQYNIYKAQPSFGTPVPAGSLLGYAGTAYGTQWNDTNVVADFSQVPPRHLDPFARGQIIAVKIVTGGSGYTEATASISTSTGSGASVGIVVQNGSAVAAIINDAGKNYKDGDTIAIGGNGSGATATLSIGAQTGTYPSTVSYFQERRVFANSLNNTDTYWMSQPGAFENFDARIPPIDTDAIVGSPWSVEVNGIQWMEQTSGGLLVMTGLSAWLLVGAGSFATNVQAISPASQDAVTQAFSGVSPTVPPVKIHYDVIYVNSKGSYYYALPYQLYVLSEPVDLTELSSHLFDGFSILENAWCEQPSKVLWAIRDDGVMLSMTYYKAQQVVGWSRHDTNGEFVSCASVTELPIDALYVATKRYPGTKTAYMVERMDDRLWTQVEDAWCIDAGLTLPQPTPNATLTADSATGAGHLTGVTGLIGGAGYSAATICTITDDDGAGPGSGAVAVPVITGGAITGVTFTNAGSGYVRPAIAFSDPAGSAGGSGASASVILDNSATFTASTAVFSSGDVGQVIRMGGGIATITAFTDSEHVTADISTPITDLIPNSGGKVTPQPSGSWTMTAPVTQVFGLDHLIGATVTGLADGNVISPRIVAADGSITLDAPASSVTVGLGFQAQLQPVYFEAPGAVTTQGQRKKNSAVNVLLQASRGVKAGGAQPDGATQSPPQIAPEWQNLTEVDTSPNVPLPAYNSSVVPLYTGYFRVPVEVGFNLTGQSSLQQDLPLPMNVVAIVQEVLGGDTPDNAVQNRKAA